MPREYRLYLQDIVDSIDDIEEYIQGIDFEEFVRNHMIQDAVIRRLEIIGEAVKNIPDEIKERRNVIEWRKITGFRDVVAHQYFSIMLDFVWEIVETKLFNLKLEVEDELRGE